MSAENDAAARRLSAALKGTELSGHIGYLRHYREYCITPGRDVCVRRGEETRRGRALDVEEDLSLLVRYEDGGAEAVRAGEVSVRGPGGYAH